MSLSAQEIKEILEYLEASGWDEAQVTVGEVTLTVSKGNGSLAALEPAPAPPPENGTAPPPSTEATSEPATGAAPAVDGQVIEAPSVGVFWRAPEPGAAPFVDVGDAVKAGDTLCICEVMKLFQHVITEVPGVVAAIHVNNGDHVEYGQPLFTIAPEA